MKTQFHPKEVKLMKITLEAYINRYIIAKEMLPKHPENRKLIEKKIKEAKDGILNCVLAPDFLEKIKGLDI